MADWQWGRDLEWAFDLVSPDPVARARAVDWWVEKEGLRAFARLESCPPALLDSLKALVVDTPRVAIVLAGPLNG